LLLLLLLFSLPLPLLLYQFLQSEDNRQVAQLRKASHRGTGLTRRGQNSTASNCHPCSGLRMHTTCAWSCVRIGLARSEHG